MRLFVISDTHIQGPDEAFYKTLIVFLKNTLCSGDRLILAGDIFDVFIGSHRYFRERYSLFFQTLHDLVRKGVIVYCLDGNHDIHYASIAIPGVQYVAECSLLCGEQRLFCAHGDLVNRADIGYRLLRVILRSMLLRVFFHFMSGALLQRMASRLSRYSRDAHEPALRIVYRNFAAMKVQEGYSFVILGHVHDPDHMRFTFDGNPGEYMNVGYPKRDKTCIVWQDGQLQRIPFGA